MTETLQLQRQIGAQLRGWRERRRLSQMDLALRAEVSTRHLSFIETGRSQPSREMILRLAEQMELPACERNHLLLSGGYAPVYSESTLDAPDMTAVRAAISQLLVSHEPYPAVVVDRSWNLVDGNSSVELLTAGTASWLLKPPANAVRIGLHPDGMAPRIVNLGEWHGHLLSRVRKQAALSGDPELRELYREIRGYRCDQHVSDAEISGPGSIVVPLRIRYQDRELVFVSMVATLGTPLDITVAELAIESFLPANDETRLFLHSRAAGCRAEPGKSLAVRTVSADFQG
jgi:transcriptional regulator with XRE-family HTH domain